MEKSTLLLFVLYVYVVLYVMYAILWFHLIKHHATLYYDQTPSLVIDVIINN